MNWTSRDEKEILKEWAKAFYSEDIEENIFTKIEEKQSTYWLEYNNISDIVDYDFSSMSDIENLLKLNLQESYLQEIFLPLDIGILKGRVQLEKSNSSDKLYNESKNEDEFKISEFVYVF